MHVLSLSPFHMLPVFVTLLSVEVSGRVPGTEPDPVGNEHQWNGFQA